MSIQKYKYAIFDFCETLVDKQTADDFIAYCLKNSNQNNRYLAFLLLKKSKILDILSKAIYLFPLPKYFYLKLLSNLNRSDIESLCKGYGESLFMESRIKPIYDDLLELYNSGSEIVIVSGGFSDYIRYFFLDIEVVVVATELSFDDDGLLIGQKGSDCLGDEKLNYLRKYDFFNDITLDNSIVYSDSLTDIPLFSLSNNKVFVTRKERKGSKYLMFLQKVWNDKR